MKNSIKDNIDNIKYLCIAGSENCNGIILIAKKQVAMTIGVYNNIVQTNNLELLILKWTIPLYAPFSEQREYVPVCLCCWNR